MKLLRFALLCLFLSPTAQAQKLEYGEGVICNAQRQAEIVDCGIIPDSGEPNRSAKIVGTGIQKLRRNLAAELGAVRFRSGVRDRGEI